MPPVYRQALRGGWIELSHTPEGWHARCHDRGENRANKRLYPSPVAALVALQRGRLEDPAFELLLQQVRRASLAPLSAAG